MPAAHPTLPLRGSLARLLRLYERVHRDHYSPVLSIQQASGNYAFCAQKAYLGLIQATNLEHIIDLRTIYYLS